MLFHFGLTSLSTIFLFSMPPDGGIPIASAGDEAVPVISTREQFLPGSDPHSPSTIDHPIYSLSNWRPTPAESGSTGLLHLSTAKLGPVGLFRLSGLSQYLRGNNFPSPGLTDVRTAAGFAASWNVEEHLETFFSYVASADRQSAIDLNVFQGKSDLQFGAKWATGLGNGWFVGPELAGSTEIGGTNSGLWAFRPRVLATYDARDDIRALPTLLHANLGVALQKRGGEALAGHPFAPGASQYHRVLGGVGIETPLPWITPFLEYDLSYPIGAGGGLTTLDGVTVRAVRAMPQSLTVGGRLTAIQNLTLTLAFDLGLNRTVATGLPPAAPFNFVLGAAFNTNFLERSDVRIVETVREQLHPNRLAIVDGQITGVVLDSSSRKPVSAALVTINGSDLPPVATDQETGRFLSQALPSGGYEISVQREGFRTAGMQAKVEAGQLLQLEVMLERLAPQSMFSVSAASKGKPIAANVSFAGDTQRSVTLSATGSAKLALPPGQYEINVNAPGFLAQTREVQVSQGSEMSLTFELSPEPAKKLVTIKKDKIEILQQIHFATGKATILMDSYGLLNQVIDAIVRNNIRRIRIEGHTDNQGSKRFNQSLSEQRARAVADYLLRAGIDRSRVQSMGYGDSRPIAPNMNSTGRELNRRVEFFILEPS